MFCWHKWSEWEVVDKGQIIRSRDDRVVGVYIIQEKQCLRCKKIDVRKQTTLNQ